MQETMMDDDGLRAGGLQAMKIDNDRSMPQQAPVSLQQTSAATLVSSSLISEQEILQFQGALAMDV